MKASPQNGFYTITANEYDPALYSDVVVTSPSIIDSQLPNPSNPPPVTALAATEDVVQTKDGLYISRIRIDWTDPAAFPISFVRSFRVQIYDPSLVLVHTADVTSHPMTTPSLKELVTYTVKVYVISATGVVSAVAATTLTPQGKYLPPSNVSNLTGFEAGGRVFLTWGAAIDLTLDTIRYEVRYGATSTAWDTAALLDRVSALTFGTPGFPTGLYRFYVKALDSVGNYSATAAFVDVVVSVDNAAFSAYTYTNAQVEGLAVTEWISAGVRYATTDFGATMQYGHSTVLNTSGLWDDGTVPGSTVGTQPHQSALRFVAALNRYVAVPYVAAQNVGTSFYVEAWVYPTSHEVTGRSIFSQRTANDAGGWDLRIANGTLFCAGTTAIAQSNEQIPLFKWTHVAFKVTASVAKLYINGNEVTYSAGPNAYTYLNNTNPRWIGAIRTGALFSFDGLIVRTKLWNTALSDANRLISMQYYADPTSIGGMVGCWFGGDAGEGSTSTTYADSGTGASNGAITPSVEWKSWSYVTSAPIDLGQSLNATFTVSGGELTALNGAAGPLLMTSADGITYTVFRQPSVLTTARFFKYGYEAQGGSIQVNLSTLRGDVLVTPRTEVVTANALSGSLVTVSLVGLYAKCIDLQMTYAGGTSGAGSAWFAVPDRIEVGSKGIVGGVYKARLGNWTDGSGTGRYSVTSFALSSTFTYECWYRRLKDTVDYSVLFDFPNTGSGTWHRLVIQPSGVGNNVYLESNGSAPIFDAGGGVPVKGPLVADGWTHIACVGNGTSWSLYYDGVLKGTVTQTAATNASLARTWWIAGESVAFYSPFEIYDIRVWDEARTQAQIIANMKTRVPAGGNLKAYWTATRTIQAATATR
jgi:hypothetical protein